MVKNLPAKPGDVGDADLIPGSGRSLGGEMAAHSTILAWKKSHGQRSLAGCRPWGHKEWDTIEHLNMHTHT